MNPEHDFQWALTELKAGRQVRRSAWAGDVFLELKDKKIVMKAPDGASMRWMFASQDDILGEDWVSR
ncbi:MAG: Thoeris anti-defense Tad2 family protein [bacterium]